jgi:hypothetical protein
MRNSGRVSGARASAATIALELLAGPVCTANLVGGLGWFTGWDIDPAADPMTIMLETWGRIGGVPYPAASKPA